mgnify:CR=1 FL=1|jgi:hypothetical protein
MGGRGASSESTGINNEMTRIRNLLKILIMLMLERLMNLLKT